MDNENDIEKSNMSRLPLSVLAEFDCEGNMRPVKIKLGDGREYRVDRVDEVVRRPALRAGGAGLRFKVLINGVERYIFFEPSERFASRVVGHWFAERKQ